MEDEYEIEDGFEPKSPSAIDFYDIGDESDELESDDPESKIQNKSDSDEDYSLQNVENKILTFTNISIPDKPLSAVLPIKYQNVSVKELFPHFRDGQVLRFLKLFGPGKPTSMPDIWRSIRKKKQEIDAFNQPAVHFDHSYEIESDDETKFIRRVEKKSVLHASIEHPLAKKCASNSWRFGPAKLWYDMVEVSETAENYDYGLKVKEISYDDCIPDTIPGEAFLMLAQCTWENDVIWDGDEIREEIMKNIYCPNKIAGWIPIGSDRTIAAFYEKAKSSSIHKPMFLVSDYVPEPLFNKSCVVERDLKESMFPEENLKLLYDEWESDIIWDNEAMQRISYPKPCEIDNTDIISEIPDDEIPSEYSNNLLKDRKNKKTQLYSQEDDDDDDTPSQLNIKIDFYNISNDEYYNPKFTQDAALKLGYGGSLLQHSIPALELRSPIFPTFIGPMKLRKFHRLPLKQYSHGRLAYVDFHRVHSLTKHIRRKKAERQNELKESGGGEMFFMRSNLDLSGKDGNLVLFEFSEEHPPLINQIGMASKIRNYYRRRPGKEMSLINYRNGETAYAQRSQFLGSLQPGQSLQAYENNLFRSPIYEHMLADIDFLIIRTRHKFYLRDVETIYVVGQQLPLLEVPAPKSERSNNFMKDFLMVFIYRLFWKSQDYPRRIKMETIKKAFPSLREFSIRKRLNICADFQRTGFDSKHWVLKSGFRLPTEEEIRQMVSPEQCCAYYCMLAAEQRLKDAGYGDKFLLMAEDENDFLQNKIDDEIKAAPWNVTQAFISAARGKSFLELSGVADPTGCDEGFSYVKAPNKHQWLKDDNPVKRLVKGTDADLRRLSLSNAKKLLKSFGISDKDIKSMTRWQMIDVIRTHSTQQARLGEEESSKFARGNLYSQAEHLRRYKEECQRLFDLQNRMLSSKEILSTDEESSSEEDSDLEEMGKHIESILSNKKTLKELSHDCEEAERKELQKLITSDARTNENPKNKLERNENSSMEGKILKIYRTFTDANGYEFVRVETVRRTEVMELYVKIRQTKSDEFIKDFSLDKEQKEAYKRERRRLQDQLRRLKRNELKDKEREPYRKRMKMDAQQLLKVKCGACGSSGHMRTNRACPLYQSSAFLPPIQVAMTEEQEEEEEKTALHDKDLIKLDETKIILSKQLIKHADEIRRKSLVLKIPKEVMNAARKKKKEMDFEGSDYMSAPKLVNRKRIDPVVSISVIFEKLLNEIKALPDTQPFWYPVNVKQAPNYRETIAMPMDLHTMRDKIRQQKYKSREEFLKDMELILENSSKYNGAHSFLSMIARSMLDHCFSKFSEEEERLMDLEKAINPLLDNDQVAFSYMLETIVSEHLKTVPESWPFHKPVDKRVAKNYYEIVKQPMDLDCISRNCKSHKYKDCIMFLVDVKLIHSNSIIFNGPTSQYTKIAEDIVNAAQAALDMYSEQLERFELGIKSLGKANSVGNIDVISPKTAKSRQVGRPKSHTTGQYNCNGDDSFVDVESVEAISVVCSEKDADSFEKSDVENIVSYPTEESNSSFVYSPVLAFDQESNTCTSLKVQSFQPLNGYFKMSTDCSNDSAGLYSHNICDNICDDLMLSESDSDDNMQISDDTLHF